jgi:pullulanase/glycogen debranching enzyme
VGDGHRVRLRSGIPEPVVKYIKELGVTSVELLPIHFSLNDSHLLEKGLTSYWGSRSPFQPQQAAA